MLAEVLAVLTGAPVADVIAVDARRAQVRRTWPASTAVRALGLHLVALDDARVVLAVEALP